MKKVAEGLKAPKVDARKRPRNRLWDETRKVLSGTPTPSCTITVRRRREGYSRGGEAQGEKRLAPDKTGK